jgi:hypothetical protein
MRLETRRRTAHVAVAAVIATASFLLLADGSAVARTSLTSGTTLVGTWTRKNSCSAFVKALTRAGLRASMKEWLVGAGFFKSPGQISTATPCRGATNVKHSHFFTRPGGFGSYDETGQQVDDGDYKIVAPNILAFPSHAQEFGHKVKVRYKSLVTSSRFRSSFPTRVRASAAMRTVGRYRRSIRARSSLASIGEPTRASFWRRAVGG